MTLSYLLPFVICYSSIDFDVECYRKISRTKHESFLLTGVNKKRQVNGMGSGEITHSMSRGIE
jgi:hypothetical protein